MKRSKKKKKNWIWSGPARLPRARRQPRRPRSASRRASLSGRMEQRKKEDGEHRHEVAGFRWREKEGKEEVEWKGEAER